MQLALSFAPGRNWALNRRRIRRHYRKALFLAFPRLMGFVAR